MFRVSTMTLVIEPLLTRRPQAGNACQEPIILTSAKEYCKHTQLVDS